MTAADSRYVFGDFRECWARSRAVHPTLPTQTIAMLAWAEVRDRLARRIADDLLVSGRTDPALLATYRRVAAQHAAQGARYYRREFAQDGSVTP